MRTKHGRKNKAMSIRFSFQANARSKMADCVSIRPSKIEGVGIFANEDIQESTIIQKTHFNHKEYGWTKLIPNCKYNHSKFNANCKLVENNQYKELVTLRSINKDEEILVNYNDCPELELPEEDWVE